MIAYCTSVVVLYISLSYHIRKTLVMINVKEVVNPIVEKKYGKIIKTDTLVVSDILTPCHNCCNAESL